MIKATAVYLTRALLTFAILGLLFLELYKKSGFGAFSSGDYAIAVLSQLDIFHQLFYALSAAALFILAFSFRAKPISPASRFAVRLLAPPLLGLAAGSLLVAAVWSARPDLPCGYRTWCGAVYVAFNVTLWWWGAAWGEGAKWRAIVRRLAPATDLLAPLPLWAAYRDRHRGFSWGLQLVPLCLLTVVCLLPWFARPLPEPVSHQHPDAAFRPITRGAEPLYQLAVDPVDGHLISCDDHDHLYKIDAASGRVRNTATVELRDERAQGFGFDPLTREVVVVGACIGRTFWFDATDLRPTRVTPITSYRTPKPVYCGITRFATRTQWSAASGILIAFTYFPGFLLLDRDGGQVLFDTEILTGGQSPIGLNTADAVIDANDRKVHWITTGRAAADFDVDRRRVDHVLRLPSIPERIALDAKRHRLFITLPIIAQVLVVDARTYRPVAFIPTFPGVRMVVADEERDRLYLGGFSPVFEIRSLADYSLVDRLTSPSWLRWIAVDNRREKVAIEAHYGGAWELDLRRLRQESRGSFWRRIDPAYPVFRALTRLARRIILLTHPLPGVFS